MIRILHNWTSAKLEDRLLKKFGGIQTCPWCLQRIQAFGDWSIEEWTKDPFVDVITCGPCGGTSLWRFEMGMLYVGPLNPPQPKHDPAPYYDIVRARLRKTTE